MRSVVFCIRHGNGERAVYDGFLHEVDVLFIATARAVEEGALAALVACNEWSDYYEDEEDEEDDAGGDDDDPPGFPSLDEIWDSDGGLRHATHAFYFFAERTPIDGIGEVFENISVASGVVWEVHGAATMRQLRDALRDEYKIVVMQDTDYAYPASIEAAEQMITQARKRRKLE